MITRNELMVQLQTKPFRRLLFTIFNTIEDDGFFAEAKCVNNKDYDMDDFECMMFDLSEEDRKAIKNKKVDILSLLNDFKYHIEKEKQPKFANCRIYIFKDIGSVCAVKLKEFNVKELFQS
jgi:hypothetical protein